MRQIRAFALFEIMIAISVIGMFMTLSIKSWMQYLTYQRKVQKDKITKRNSDRILKALGNHVVKQGYLPYPSQPKDDDDENFGVSRPSPKTEESWAQEPEAFRFGIVPFKSLGMPEEDAKDGNGNFFSYAVNPTLCGRSAMQYASVKDSNYLKRDISRYTPEYQHISCYLMPKCIQKAALEHVLDPIVVSSLTKASNIIREPQLYCIDLTSHLLSSRLELRNKLSNGQWEDLTFKLSTFHKLNRFEDIVIGTNGPTAFLDPSAERLLLNTPNQATDLSQIQDVRNWLRLTDVIAVILISHTQGGGYNKNRKKQVCTGTAVQVQNTLPTPHFFAGEDDVFWTSRSGLLINIGEYYGPLTYFLPANICLR